MHIRKTALQKYGSFEQFTKSIKPFKKPAPGSVRVIILPNKKCFANFINRNRFKVIHDETI